MYTEEDILQMVDNVIKIIRNSMSKDEAKETVTKFGIAITLGLICEFNKENNINNKEVN